MSTMSSAPFAFASQNAFSRASISCAAACRRQDVHVGRPELDEEFGDRLDVRVEPVVVVALHADDEVGERGRLDILGDAELEAVLALDRRHRQHVDVLEDRRTRDRWR